MQCSEGFLSLVCLPFAGFFKVVPGVCGLTLLSKWRYLSLILNQLTVNCRAGSLVKSTTLLYLSLSTRALIGQFCGPYSPLRPAVRPAKFENLVQHFVANMSREEKFDTYLKELRTNREKQQKPEESMPNFQTDFLQLLEEGQRQMAKDEQAEQDEPGSSQELDDFISSEKSENTVKKTNYEWKNFKHFVRNRATEALM